MGPKEHIEVTTSSAEKDKKTLPADTKESFDVLRKVPADIGVKPSDKIKMNVLRGRNLEKQKFGKPDPYVILSYGEQIEKSKVVQGNLNPEWNLEKIFSVTKNSPKEILIEVYDKDKITKDDFMGRTSILISDIPKLSQGSWIPLKDCKNGEILLSAEIIPSISEIPTARESELKDVRDEGTPAAPIKQIEVTTSPVERDNITLDSDKKKGVEVIQKVPADTGLKSSKLE